MKRHRRPASILAALIVSTNSYGCNPPAAPVCTVTATPGQIVASFPILKPPFVWRWLRPQTQDNDLEYRWQVEFGQCGADGNFDVGEYAYGVQLFKFPGSAARTGQLPSLLAQAQHTFARRKTEAGRVIYSMVPEAKVSSLVDGVTLKVTVSGRDRVAQLLASLPKHALFTVNTPEPGGSYTCYAEVQYAQ